MTKTTRQLKELLLAAASGNSNDLIRQIDSLEQKDGWRFEVATSNLIKDKEVSDVFYDAWVNNNWSAQKVFQHVYDGEAERFFIEENA